MVNMPVVYVYAPDPEKSPDENVDAIANHMRLALNGQESFRLTLELEISQEHTMSTEETAAMIMKAMAETEAAEKTEYVPVAVGKNGKVLYQRREDAE